MSHLCSLVVVLVPSFSLTNIKFKKHIISTKTGLVFFQWLVAHRDWGSTIWNTKHVIWTLAIFFNLMRWVLFFTAKLSVLVIPKHVNRKLSGTCECADNPLHKGVPPSLSTAPTPGRKHVIRDGDVQLQALDGVTYNNEPVPASPLSQALSWGIEIVLWL